MNKKPLSPFQQALLDAQMEQWKDIPSEEEMEITLSEEFQEKGNELIRRTKQGKLQGISTTVRRIILVAAIIAALAVTAIARPMLRGGENIRFEAVNMGIYYAFRFDPEQKASAPETIGTRYIPTYIPEGYWEKQRDIGNTSTYIEWRTDSGAYIVYDQITIPDFGSFTANSENVETEILKINGFEIFAIYSRGSTTYYWTDSEYFYSLFFHISVSREERIKVFCSITEQ